MLNGLPIVFSETRAEEAFVSLVWSYQINSSDNDKAILSLYCNLKREFGTPQSHMLVQVHFYIHRISRTVWTFAKNTEISQNTENFHHAIQTVNQIVNWLIKLCCLKVLLL
jgi:hypothetical protein